MSNFFKTAKNATLTSTLLASDTTLYSTPTEPTKGYIVGNSRKGIVLGADLSGEERWPVALAYVRATAKWLSHGQTLGSWTDTDGSLCIDPGRVYESRANATAAAKYSGEKAIWDIENAQEIRV